jgi:sigma-B regulation protein RsbQ
MMITLYKTSTYYELFKGEHMSANIIQKYNVNVLGSGSTTLVFAHGFGSEQEAWRHQIAAFQNQYRIVLFDYLGCGKSDISNYNPLYYNSLARYAEDVLAIYEALDLKDTIYVGHSVSGMIGMLASKKAPARFRDLIFVSSSPRYLNDGDYVGGFEQSDLESLYAAMAANYLNWASGLAPIAVANAEHPELGREFARTLGAMRPDIAQSTARVIFETDMRSQLPSVQHPALFLQSTNDAVVPPSVGDYLMEHCPDSRLVMLNAEGHLPHFSSPDEVTRAIWDFLTDRQN